MDGFVFERSRLRSLLEHFAAIGDPREPAKVRYPLPEVLLLVVAASIADCDDYDEIVDWGEAHLDFLRGHSEFHFGIPDADWLRVVMNRIEPALFQACFTSWASALRPDAADLIAIEGKDLASQSRPHPGSARAAPVGTSGPNQPGPRPSAWCWPSRRWRTRRTSAASSPTCSTGCP